MFSPRLLGKVLGVTVSKVASSFFGPDMALGKILKVDNIIKRNPILVNQLNIPYFIVLLLGSCGLWLSLYLEFTR